MGNWVGVIGATVAFGCLLPGLVAGLWLDWKHRAEQGRVSGVSAAVAALVSLTMFCAITHPLLGVWFWRVSLWIGLYWVIYCGLPIAALRFFKK